MSQKTPITVAHGDGIGPEIMEASLHIIQEAGAALEIETIEIGEKVYLRGNTAGIDPSAWESLRRTKVFYKAPITTPQGGGFKSLNVTARKRLGLYANIRPCVAYHPYVDTKHPGMDVVIVRENEEDLYAGIEYQLSSRRHGVPQAHLASRQRKDRPLRLRIREAEWPQEGHLLHERQHHEDDRRSLPQDLRRDRRGVSGHREGALDRRHRRGETGRHAEAFDVIVMPNLYGDILSDVAAQIAGSVGLAGSANVGITASMFEAIHGSAPRRAGQNLANPSGLLLGGVMMLVHIGQWEAAERVHNAWLRTIEDGIHTYDIYEEGVSKQKVGTKEFAQAVVARHGPEAGEAEGRLLRGAPRQRKEWTPNPARRSEKVEMVGVDLYMGSNGRTPQELRRRARTRSRTKASS